MRFASRNWHLIICLTFMAPRSNQATDASRHDMQSVKEQAPWVKTGADSTITLPLCHESQTCCKHSGGLVMGLSARETAFSRRYDVDAMYQQGNSLFHAIFILLNTAIWQSEKQRAVSVFLSGSLANFDCSSALHGQ